MAKMVASQISQLVDAAGDEGCRPVNFLFLGESGEAKPQAGPGQILSQPKRQQHMARPGAL